MQQHPQHQPKQQFHLNLDTNTYNSTFKNMYFDSQQSGDMQNMQMTGQDNATLSQRWKSSSSSHSMRNMNSNNNFMNTMNIISNNRTEADDDVNGISDDENLLYDEDPTNENMNSLNLPNGFSSNSSRFTSTAAANGVVVAHSIPSAAHSHRSLGYPQKQQQWKVPSPRLQYQNSQQDYRGTEISFSKNETDPAEQLLVGAPQTCTSGGTSRRAVSQYSARSPREADNYVQTTSIISPHSSRGDFSNNNNNNLHSFQKNQNHFQQIQVAQRYPEQSELNNFNRLRAKHAFSNESLPLPQTTTPATVAATANSKSHANLLNNYNKSILQKMNSASDIRNQSKHLTVDPIAPSMMNLMNQRQPLQPFSSLESGVLSQRNMYSQQSQNLASHVGTDSGDEEVENGSNHVGDEEYGMHEVSEDICLAAQIKNKGFIEQVSQQSRLFQLQQLQQQQQRQQLQKAQMIAQKESQQLQQQQQQQQNQLQIRNQEQKIDFEEDEQMETELNTENCEQESDLLERQLLTDAQSALLKEHGLRYTVNDFEKIRHLKIHSNVMQKLKNCYLPLKVVQYEKIIEKSNSNIDALKQAVTTLLSREKILSDEFNSLITELKRMIEITSTQSMNLREKENQLMKQQIKLEAKDHEVRAVTKQLQQLKSESSHFEEFKASLEHRVKESNLTIEMLRTQNEELSAENHLLREEKRSQIELINNLERTCNARDEKTTQLLLERKSITDEYNTRQSGILLEIQKYRDESNLVRSENRKLTKSNADLTADINALKSSLVDLTSLLPCYRHISNESIDSPSASASLPVAMQYISLIRQHLTSKDVINNKDKSNNSSEIILTSKGVKGTNQPSTGFQAGKINHDQNSFQSFKQLILPPNPQVSRSIRSTSAIKLESN